MIKLYRININTLEDPLQNENVLEQVGPERRKKVIRYLQPDDRKRSLGAGIMIRKILNGNGLSESSLKYSENGKPLADHLHFNISHAGEYVVGVVSDGEGDATLSGMSMRLWKLRSIISIQQSGNI